MAESLALVMPIYDGVTHLDFTGPQQFFARTEGIRVTVASIEGAPVTAEGLTFAGLADLTRLARCEVLCVPGGTGCAAAMEDVAYMAAIRRLASSARYVTSVCTGSLILGAAGLLKGKRAACHWAWRDMLPLFGAIPDTGRVVRDGNVITGGGVTAGIDFALVLIAELFGDTSAETVQLALEYAPAPPFDAGRPETAPPAARAHVASRNAAAMPARRTRIEKIAAILPR